MTATAHKVFLPNQSDAQDAPDEFLSDLFSVRSRNMELYNQRIQGRLGLSKFSATQLYGQVRGIANFDKFNGDKFVVYFTTKEIYSYDTDNARFDILNPLYNTGTIEVKTGELTKVYGSGTTWSTNVKVGDRIKIGAGNVHTGSTWYTVSAVDSDTLLTLASSAPITAASTAYVVAQCYELGAEDFWDWDTFQDAVLGEVLVATNFIDTPVYWTGSAQVVSLSGLPDSMKAKYVKAYKGRLHFAHTNEGGYNQPQRHRWSVVANCLSYLAVNFQDFADEASSVSGLCKFGNYLVDFKDDCVYIGRFIDGDYVFEWEKAPFGEGCRSHLSIVVRKEGIYYYGADKKFHKWNLQSDSILTESIFPETREFDPNLDALVCGADFSLKNQIRWFCPYSSTSYNNFVVVYDYKNAVVKVWEYSQAQALGAIGHYIAQSDLYVDDAVWGELYVDEQEGWWDDQQFLANAPVFLYGGYDGYIRLCDNGILDDGETYTRSMKMKRFNFDLPEFFKRLWRQQVWLEAQTSGSLTIKMQMNDDTGFDGTTKVIDMTNLERDVIKMDIIWDKRAQNFQETLESTAHFALLGIISWIFKKRRAN